MGVITVFNTALPLLYADGVPFIPWKYPSSYSLHFVGVPLLRLGVLVVECSSPLADLGQVLVESIQQSLEGTTFTLKDSWLTLEDPKQ